MARFTIDIPDDLLPSSHQENRILHALTGALTDEDTRYHCIWQADGYITHHRLGITVGKLQDA